MAEMTDKYLNNNSVIPDEKMPENDKIRKIGKR